MNVRSCNSYILGNLVSLARMASFSAFGRRRDGLIQAGARSEEVLALKKTARSTATS